LDYLITNTSEFPQAKKNIPKSKAQLEEVKRSIDNNLTNGKSTKRPTIAHNALYSKLTLY
jgi:hypothetical protein